MKIYKAITFENKIKPIKFVRKVEDNEGNIIRNSYISDDCELYDIDVYDSYDYFGDCPKSDINIRKDDRGRLYASINPESENHSQCQHLARVAKRAFDEEKHPLSYYRDKQIDHINPSIPLDNNILNLDWVSREENMERAAESGLMIKKYKKDLVHEICQMICQNVPRYEIVELLNINGQLVDDIRSGRSHKSASKQYLDKGFTYKKIDRNEKYELVNNVCQLIENGYRNCEIAKKLNVRQAFVKDIRAHATFKDISKDYNF
jgi:hypothetical protein